MKTLKTTTEVIEALGGTNAVRKLVGAQSHQRVYNWIMRGNFPPETYPVITEALAEQGKSAEPTLWKSVPVSVLPAVISPSAA